MPSGLDGINSRKPFPEILLQVLEVLRGNWEIWFASGSWFLPADCAPESLVDIPTA